MESGHLFIGLGRTGGRVLRALRKRMASCEGENLPPCEYLYYDVSTDELDPDKWRVFGGSVELRRNQILISPTSSLPEESHAPINRSGSRKQFAQVARQFCWAIDGRVRELQREWRGNMIFHIVADLGESVGGGVLVDVIELLRYHYPYEDDLKNLILLYSILPDRAGQDFHKTAAQAYATLSEINALDVGAYRSINPISGQPYKLYGGVFNGCYLVENECANGRAVDWNEELPDVVAEFICQRAKYDNWIWFVRLEHFEGQDKTPERSGSMLAGFRFLTFGIRRIFIPEEEIKEYLAYGFAEQVTRQLMYNNFQQGAGFAQEEKSRDYHSIVRDPKELQGWLISDDHLTLSVGILQDDAANARWKKIPEFWQNVVNTFKTETVQNKNIEKTDWVNHLATDLDKVFDEGYRALGGVRKFYEAKGKAAHEMAKYIVRNMEKQLFLRWKTGEWSLAELRKLLDAFLKGLEEKQGSIDERINKMTQLEEQSAAKRSELLTSFNEVGTLGRIFTDKCERLFSEIAQVMETQFQARTFIEGWRFAKILTALVKDEMTSLRGEVDRLHQSLTKVTDECDKRQQSRLQQTDNAYQTRLFDLDAIKGVMKTIITDEQGQKSRTQQVRTELIKLSGNEVDSFERVNENASLEGLLAALENQSAQIVEAVHAEVAKSKPGLKLNIVEWLREKKIGEGDEAIFQMTRTFSEYENIFLRFSDVESKYISGSYSYPYYQRRVKAVFMPEHIGITGFMEKPSGDINGCFGYTSCAHEEVRGSMANEIILLNIVNCFPLRHLEVLSSLKEQYDIFYASENGRALLHGEDVPATLPSLLIEKE